MNEKSAWTDLRNRKELEGGIVEVRLGTGIFRGLLKAVTKNGTHVRIVLRNCEKYEPNTKVWGAHPVPYVDVPHKGARVTRSDSDSLDLMVDSGTYSFYRKGFEPAASAA